MRGAGSEKVAEHGSGARRHRGHFVGRQKWKYEFREKFFERPAHRHRGVSEPLINSINPCSQGKSR